MLERLDGHDWQAHAAAEPHAPRLPRLLRRYLGGNEAAARKALRRIWFALARDDGYINSAAVVALTATAVAEVVDELAATARRRAARLLGHLNYEMWLNIYGQPDPSVG